MKTLIKQERITVKVKQRKNGDFYANVSNINLPIEQKTVSMTANRARGAVYTSVTLVCSYYSEERYNTVFHIWNR